MTKETVLQLIRDVFKIAGGSGILAGIAAGDVWITIGAGVAALVGVVWGLAERREVNAKKG